MKIPVKILSTGTDRSEQISTGSDQMALKSSLIRVYIVCHSSFIIWMHYCIVNLNHFNFRTVTIGILGVPIFKVSVVHLSKLLYKIFILRWGSEDNSEVTVSF